MFAKYNGSMDDIAVIIVNWNAREDLRLCLRSLFASPPTVQFAVWVVDNASTDGSVQMARLEFPDVHIVENENNVGFSRANNQAIAATDSRYVFLLNSDAAVKPGAVDRLVAFADANPTAGIIGPKVLNTDGSLQFSCRRFPTWKAGLFRNTWLGRLAPNNKHAAAYLMADVAHDQVRRADWLSGCAMMIRRTLIDEIGALDDRFYMYCEDVDICKRAWNAGKEVVYFPDAVVTHAIGRSSDKNAERMIVEFHRSWFEFDKKHHPGGGPIRRGAVYSGLWLRGFMRIARRRLFVLRRRAAVSANPTKKAVLTDAADKGFS